MGKLCPAGKAAAKRKFKVYPSAYANAYAVRYCKGQIGNRKPAKGYTRKSLRISKKWENYQTNKKRVLTKLVMVNLPKKIFY